jgi:hypothetical protein
MEQHTSADLFDLRIDPQTSSLLTQGAKWGRFLAIVGFVSCGLILLLSLFAGSIFSSAFKNYYGESAFVGSAFISFSYVLIALLLFFPCLFLYNYSTKMLQALRGNDQELLSSSFRNLKSLFKFYGVMTVIMLAFYAIFIIFLVIGAATH